MKELVLLLFVLFIPLKVFALNPGDTPPIDIPEMYKLSKNFTYQEFRCKHCNKLRIDMNLVYKLEELRKLIGNKKIYVTSGYRCPLHNKAVGGVKNSQHLYGRAADIYVKEISIEQLYQKAKKIGFGYVKKYPKMIHVDIGRKR